MAENEHQLSGAGLAPTGALRVAVAIGPTGSPLWATRGADGKPQGVTVDLGAALAQALGVPVEYVAYSSTGEITDAAASGAWDVSFMPVDEDRKTKVDFGPNYALGESTYLVAPGSTVTSIDEVDRPGLRVVGVENTTTIRAARRGLKHATVTGAKGPAEILAMLKAGELDAVALGRDTLEDFAQMVPGARVLPGHFWAVGYAPAVPKGRPAAAIAFVGDFIESAKADGSVQRAFERAGLAGATLAPAGSRS